MVNIPITPSLIAGALPYGVPTTASPINICKQPKEGVKCVSMQFGFSTTPVWQVDMSVGSPNPPLEQVASLFVDTSNSTHDVNILFPDTGYQVRVPQGGSQIIPVITAKQHPLFYVILDSQNLVSATDMINIIALNTFIPEFTTSGFLNAIDYGYTDLFQLKPFFTQSSSFRTNPTFPGLIGNNLIPATSWFVTGFFVSCAGIVAGSTNIYDFVLIDGGPTPGTGTPIFRKAFTVDTTPKDLDIVNISGLNYQSKNTGGLYANLLLLSGIGDISDYIFRVNAYGGILVP